MNSQITIGDLVYALVDGADGFEACRGVVTNQLTKFRGAVSVLSISGWALCTTRGMLGIPEDQWSDDDRKMVKYIRSGIPAEIFGKPLEI